MDITLKTGVTLNYDIFGGPDDPPVLLVAGQHQANLFHQTQVPFLTKRGHRVITFDHRGVPPSEETPPPYTMEGLAEDTAALIEELGIGPCAIVGYSLGATVILELAAARPELLTRAVLVGVPWKPSALHRAIREDALERLRSGAVMPPVTEGIYRAMYLFGPRALNRDAFIGPYLEGLRGLAASGGHGALGHAEASAAYDPDPRRIASITVPCLVVGMEHDIMSPYPMARELAGLIPDCEYREIKNSGHAALLEKPTEVNRLLAEYLDAGAPAAPES
ncbi:putative hydrolase, alpha/beta fold protein [Streptomyces capoamus]|uniref:Hydrolase, alpha/beta fold protein n=1 Tax=Streptomyces capoamus TaxID=68183 RepID=A0A919EY57_9ACTN|nr:alpha/beta hydrolase [Streptomyces capoamus]GGW20685.1 putative hydrolase, alpha/beta fold protein [Streptomyces libani subsp. rufus]GHG57682.1 putative hydrolase, alpha/beta fold protein [Streptomyces capoamus]